MGDIDAEDELPDRDRGHYRRAIDDGPWTFDLETGEVLSPLAVPNILPAVLTAWPRPAR